MSRMGAYWAMLMVALLAGCGSGGDGTSASTSQKATAGEVAQALPLLRLSTDSGADVTSKEVYLPGSYILRDEHGQVLLSGATEIKGRGNFTWGLPKKPYHIKLATSSSLLGMPANRHWVLLANYVDKTLLRNDVTFQLSRSVRMEYTPRSKFVDVEVNGVYLGVYQLTEHVRIAPDRVNIPELKAGDTAANLITGGYLIEVDETRGEAFCFDSSRSGMTFCLKNPEKLLEAGWEDKRAYIETYIAQTEDAIFSADFSDPVVGYAAYLDVDSAINYYLINELVKNVDGDLRRSTFLYKKRDGKLTFGPVWDFDIAIGNAEGRGAETNGWRIRGAPWFDRMFQDPAFEAKVKVKWAQLKATGQLNDVFTYIDRQSLYLSKVQERNFETWDILRIFVWPSPIAPGTYAGEVAYMKDWLRDRIAWMDAEFSR